MPSATVEGVRRPLTNNNELIVARIHRSGTVCKNVYTVLLRLFGDTVGDGVVTNRVTMVQTAKKTVTKCVAGAFTRFARSVGTFALIGCIRCMKDQKGFLRAWSRRVWMLRAPGKVQT